jgi:hypothetical protein
MANENFGVGMGQILGHLTIGFVKALGENKHQHSRPVKEVCTIDLPETDYVILENQDLPETDCVILDNENQLKLNERND